MFKNSIYPLKVWLTSAIMGTMLAFMVDYIRSYFSYFGTLQYQITSSGDLLICFLLVCSIAVVAAIPCWLILWLAYAKLLTNTHKRNNVKWILFFLSQLLCWSLLAIVFRFDHTFSINWQLEIIRYYAATVGVCSLLFFPKNYPPTIDAQ